MGLLFFISLFGYAFLYKIIFPDIKSGAMIFCAFSSMLILAYALIILLGIYTIGAYFIQILGITLFVFGGTYLLVKKKFLIPTLLTPSIIIFIGIILLSAVLLRNASFLFHDEYSFWGRAAKEMYTYNFSYFNADSNISHSDYAPFFASLQYTVVRVFGWKTEYLYYVNMACLASVLSMLIDGFSLKQLKYALAFVLLVTIFYPLTSTTYTIQSLYIDGSLSFVFVGGLIHWFTRDDNKLCSILPVLLCMFILPLLKLYSGLLFALVLLACVSFEFIKPYRKSLPYNKSNRIKAPLIIVAIIMILFSQFSWSAFYNYNSAVVRYETSIAQSEYLDISVQETSTKPEFNISYIFSGNPRTKAMTNSFSDENIQRTLQDIKSSIKSLITTKIGGSNLTTLLSFALVLLGLVFLYLCLKREKKKQLLVLLIVFICASLIYIIGTFLGLLIQAYAGSIIRYMGIILISFMMILFYYTTMGLANKNLLRDKISFKLLIGITIILILNLSPEYLYNSYLMFGRYTTANHVIDVLSDSNLQIKDTERVLIIDNLNTDGYISASGIIHCYQYYALPTRLNAVYYPYGKDVSLNAIDKNYLVNLLKNNRTSKLIIMTDDARYTQKFADILGIPSDTAQPWIIDVNVINSEFYYKIE